MATVAVGGKCYWPKLTLSHSKCEEFYWQEQGGRDGILQRITAAEDSSSLQSSPVRIKTELVFQKPKGKSSRITTQAKETQREFTECESTVEKPGVSLARRYPYVCTVLCNA